MKRKRSEFPTRFLVFILILSPPKVANSNSDIWKPSAKAIYWICRNGQRLVLQHRERSQKGHVGNWNWPCGWGLRRNASKSVFTKWWLKFFEIFVRHNIHLLLNCFQALLLSAFTMFEPAHRLVFSTDEVWGKVKAYAQTCSRDIF